MDGVVYCVCVYKKLRKPLDDLDEIGRHAHGCDCAAGTVCVCVVSPPPILQKDKSHSPSTPHDQRILPIPLRVKAHHVIAPLQPRNRMRPVQLLQPDLQRLAPHVHAPDVPHHLPLPRGLVPHLGHPPVELPQPGQELVPAPQARQFRRDERLHGEAVRARDGEPGEAREDDEFPRDVQPVEVVAGVWLREALLLGLEHLLAPLTAAAAAAAFAGRRGEAVEEEAQRAGEDAFDAADGVAGRDEVRERGDDGEAGADGGFVVDEPAGAVGSVGPVGGVADGVPEVEAGGEGFLVGGHDADALGQEGRVRIRDVLAAGVVDEDALVRQLGEELEGLGRCERGRGGGFEVRFPGREGERGGAVGGAEAFGRAGDEHEGDVGVLLAEG